MAKKTPPLRLRPPAISMPEVPRDLDHVPSEEVVRRLALIDEWSKEPAVRVARALLAEDLPAGTEIEVLPAVEVQRLRALEAENIELRRELAALQAHRRSTENRQ